MDINITVRETDLARHGFYFLEGSLVENIV